MGQVFAASYLIGLREGLEMVLIVSVLVAYLVKTGRRRHLVPVWAGVAGAAALSIGFGWALSYVSTTVLAGPGQELFDAITSAVAAALVTWMVLWMRRTARRISGELRGRLDDAIGLGVGAVVGIAFLAVVREGFEATLLFFASAQGATTASPLAGLRAGAAEPAHRRDERVHPAHLPRRVRLPTWRHGPGRLVGPGAVRLIPVPGAPPGRSGRTSASGPRGRLAGSHGAPPGPARRCGRQPASRSTAIWAPCPYPASHDR